MFEFDEKILELEGKIDDVQFENEKPKGPQLRTKATVDFASTKSPTVREPKTASPLHIRKADSMQDRIKATKQFFRRSSAIVKDEQSQILMRRAIYAAKKNTVTLKSIKEALIADGKSDDSSLSSSNESSLADAKINLKLTDNISQTVSMISNTEKDEDESSTSNLSTMNMNPASLA